MARLTAFSQHIDELALPVIATINTALTYAESFTYNGITYPWQFELVARTPTDVPIIIAIGSTSGLTANAPDQSTIGNGQALYIFGFSELERVLWLAIENTTFDAAQLVQALKALADPFGGGLILETLLTGDDTVVMGDFNNTARGYGGNDTLGGGSLDDLLFGDEGADSLSGGAGNDSLDGGASNDTMVGGMGDDTFFWRAGDTIREARDEGIDTVRAYGSYTLGQTLENARLEDVDGAKNLTGNRASNFLLGNSQSNTLKGLDGIDTLWGGAGRDTLMGGTGNDRLVGQGGADLLVGGSGRDTFYFNSSDGAGRNRDTIQDFARGDIIDLTSIGLSGLSSGATANSAWLVRQAAGTRVLLDATGDAVADVEIFVKGSYRLTATDFDFV